MSEFADEYSESLEGEFRKLEEALLSEQIRLLAPSEPIRLTTETTVREAVGKMAANRRSAVVIVDKEGRLIGIFTERDVMTRILDSGRDQERTRLGEVMTPDPEALAPDDRICYAMHWMTTAGYRTVPIVDSEHRPIGIATVNDVVKWLAELFPEAVLNLRPRDKLKPPFRVDAG